MRLTTTPILIVSEQGQRYTVYCDASRDELGCVLMQFGRVVVRPEKFPFLEKGQNRNFDYKIVISVKNT